MITEEYINKHFKFHKELKVYDTNNVEMVFTQVPHFHGEGGHRSINIYDAEDLAEFCREKRLSLKPTE